MLKRLLNPMLRAQILTLAGAFWLALAGFVGDAGAAFIRLEPSSQPLPGPAVYAVILDGLSGPAVNATVELHFDATASVDGGSLAASNDGNPFTGGLPAAIKTSGCASGEPFCWAGGGFDLSGSGVAGPIQLGTLTLGSTGLPIDIVLSPGSRWTPEGGSLEALVGTGTVVARLPEPLPLLLVAIVLFALAVLRGRADNRHR